MSSVIIFERISIDPPYKKIYHRLGYRKEATELTPKQQRNVDLQIENALSFISLQGCALRSIIDKNDGNKTTISGGLTFQSVKLSGLLKNCKESLLMGATAGKEIMEAIKDKTFHDDLPAAVVYDATASEMTDAALDWIIDYINNQIRREGKKLLPRRFSAGYADLKLENQANFYQILQMEKIGVTINASHILLPEKSVTAITGICG